MFHINKYSFLQSDQKHPVPVTQSEQLALLLWILQSHCNSASIVKTVSELLHRKKVQVKIHLKYSRLYMWFWMVARSIYSKLYECKY